MTPPLFTANSSPVSISFAEPTWLVLIPILSALTWWISRRSLSNASLRRRVLLFTVRSIVLAMLCIALAQPSLDRRAKDVAVMVVRDVSSSIPPDQQRLADQFLEASAKLKQPRDRMGVITIARDAVVQTLPAAGEANFEAGSIGDTSATDLQQAIQLGRALLSPDAAFRLLLITDANQTRGSFIDAARAYASDKIPIDVASVSYDRSHEVRLASLVIPSWTRINDSVDARIVVESGRDCLARLSLLLNARPVDLDPDSPDLSTVVQLVRGPNLFTVPIPFSSSPVHQLDAVIEPIASADDPPGMPPDMPELLRASAVSFSSSHGRVLVLTDETAAAQPFVDAITDRDVAVDTRPAENIPDFAELASYDVVVMVDQPASNYSHSQQEDLARYVRDTGGGLIVLGGPHALGAGGWIGSPLADALPVLLDPPSKRKLPKGALALVIDSSGSMAQPVGATGATQQQVANEAAVYAISSLSRLDDVTVVSFNSSATAVVPLTDAGDRAAIERAIRSIGSGGGTFMFSGVEAAAEQLGKSNAGTKHIVVLTDGQTTGDPEQSLTMAADLRRRNITLSAVVIGDVPNEDLLMRLATAAGGRCYRVASNQAQTILPKIFIKEAELVRRSLIHEGKPFTPSLAFRTDSLSGIAMPLPAISGYVVTAERPGLTLVPIRGPENDPILAQWQHGLGHVTVFTSDASTRWNQQWTGWPAFSAFWKQQLAWTMRAPGDPYSRVSVAPDGESAKVLVELFDAQGEPLSFATLRARLADSPADVNFRQTGPGRYEATVTAEKTGVHLLSIEYKNADNHRGTLRAAIVKREGDELQNPTPNRDLLHHAAKLTKGRIYTLNPAGADLWIRENLNFPITARPIWLLAAICGVALFLMDVAVRRIAIDPARIRSWAFGLLSASPAARTATLRSLSAAKARATESMKQPPSLPKQPKVTSSAPTTPLISYEAPKPDAPVAPPPGAAPQEDADPMARLHAAKKRAKH